MSLEVGDIKTSLIDLTGLSLRDLAKLPESALAVALRDVLTSNGTGSSAGFSSSLRELDSRIASPA